MSVADTAGCLSFDSDRMEAAMAMTQMSQGGLVGDYYPATADEFDDRKQLRCRPADRVWVREGSNRRRGYTIMAPRPSSLVQHLPGATRGMDLDVAGASAGTAGPRDPESCLVTARDGRTIDDFTLAKMTERVLGRRSCDVRAPVGKFVRTCSQQTYRAVHVSPRSQDRPANSWSPTAADGVAARDRAADKRRRADAEVKPSQHSRPSTTRRRSSADEVGSSRKTLSALDRVTARRNSDPAARRVPLTAATSATDGRLGFPEKPLSANPSEYEGSRPDDGSSLVTSVSAAVGGAGVGVVMPFSVIKFSLFGPGLQLPVREVGAVQEKAVRTPSTSTSVSQQVAGSVTQPGVAVAVAVVPDDNRSSSFVWDHYATPNRLVLVPAAVPTGGSSEPACVQKEAIIPKAVESATAEDRIIAMETESDAEPLDLTRSAPNLVAMREHRPGEWSRHDQLSMPRHSRSSSYGSLSALKAFYEGPSMKKVRSGCPRCSPVPEKCGTDAVEETSRPPAAAVNGSANAGPLAEWHAASRNADVAAAAWRSRFRPWPKRGSAFGAAGKSSWSSATPLSSRGGGGGTDAAERAAKQPARAAAAASWNQDGGASPAPRESPIADARCVGAEYRLIRSEGGPSDMGSKARSVRSPAEMERSPSNGGSRMDEAGMVRRSADSLEPREVAPIVTLSISDRDAVESRTDRVEVHGAEKHRCSNHEDSASMTDGAVDLSRSGALLNGTAFSCRDSTHTKAGNTFCVHMVK